MTGCGRRRTQPLLDIEKDFLGHRASTEFAVHITAGMIGEADAILSRMQSTAFGGASFSSRP
jgi:hypothetical protein